MKDPDLLEATGSEPLSYEEEVEMQQSWRDDEMKCTFIVHAAELCFPAVKKFEPSTETESSDENKFLVEENLDAMIGDVNLFLSEIYESDESDENENAEIGEVNAEASEQLMQAEVDIMIAEKDFRGKGLGRAATCAMLLYGATKLGIHRFFCKINEDNIDSIRLFKAIGFEQCDYAACFKQVELELRKPLAEMERIFNDNGGSYSIMPCGIEK
jgi:RimJ/RimL family protein N-acetyltransferase